MSKIQKTLFSNILILVLINFLIKPFWTFGIDLKVQNTVGSDEYGFYYAIFNFSFLFYIFIDIGINQFHNREVARTPEKLVQQFSQLLNLKILFSLIYIMITFGAAYVLRYNPIQMKFLAILGFNQIIHSFILYNRANFTALFKFKLDTFFSVFDKLMSIIICAYLFCLSPMSDNLDELFKIEYFIYAQTFSLIVSFIISFVIIVYTEKPAWLKVDFNQFFPYLKKTLPFALAVLLMTLYTRIDAVMIEMLLPEGEGNYQAGIYAAGYKILDALNQVPFLFASFLIPVFANLLKKNEDIKPIFTAALKMLLVISIGTSVIVFFMGEDLLKLMYKDFLPHWYESFLYLSLSFNTAVFIYATGSLLTANNNMIAISVMSLLAIFINITLNYYLIKSDCASGAAKATLITQAAMAIMQSILVLKLWKFSLSIKYILQFTVYTSILVLTSYYLQSSIYNIAIIVFLGAVMAFAMNLIEWKLFLKNRNE